MGPHHDTAGPGVGKRCRCRTLGHGLHWGFSASGDRGYGNTRTFIAADPFLQPSRPWDSAPASAVSAPRQEAPCRGSVEDWLSAYVSKQTGFGCSLHHRRAGAGHLIPTRCVDLDGGSGVWSERGAPGEVVRIRVLYEAVPACDTGIYPLKPRCLGVVFPRALQASRRLSPSSPGDS